MANREADYDRIILGIDPGTNIMGYGLLGIKGKAYHLISAGIVYMVKLENHQLKLKMIFDRLTALIDQYHPDEMALEAPFFGKNVQSMLKLGRAQGVAMSAGLQKELPIFEYAPRRVKQAITGNGNAGKVQVANMLKSLIGYKEDPKYMDATDALGVALCHFFETGSIQKTGRSGGKKASSWNAFVKNNPDKIIKK